MFRRFSSGGGVGGGLFSSKARECLNMSALLAAHIAQGMRRKSPFSRLSAPSLVHGAAALSQP